ncbi:hypothetical protein ALQ06_101252 [Pseudomonas syringae pv. berberidis]|nr:hypothetical protein ALQ06_101252 [Pseudomonas syringae pv. berberidis]
MAAVNTVEIANRGDAAPMLGAQVVKASNQLHNALLAHKVADYNHTRPWTTGNTPRADEGSRPATKKNDDQPAGSGLHNGLAGEIPQAKAQHQKHGEIRHHPRRDQRTQTQKTLQHMTFVPGRHDMHEPQQHSRHDRDSNDQLEQKFRPARLRLKQILSAQLPEQQPRIDARPHADGQRQTGMMQRHDKRQVEQLSHYEGENRDFHRGADILLGIKAWGQHFDQDDTQQTYRIGDQRTLGHGRVQRIELAVLKQRNGQRLSEQAQRQCAGQHQHKTQTQAPVENPRVFLTVALRVGL